MQVNQVIQGDALEVLRGMPSGIVQACITSPPYYGLRNYQTEQIIPARSDMPDCKHEWIPLPQESQFSAYCKHCDAFKKDQQIGLEDTPDAYISRLVEVFREVRRVLRDDGTLWVNIGDSYASGGKSGEGETRPVSSSLHNNRSRNVNSLGNASLDAQRRVHVPQGLKQKDLIGIPWLLAFALRADGWYLRQDIIWHKSNSMPESVRDRCTKAHEYVFLLSKNPRYFYDQDAIREEHKTDLPIVKKLTVGHGSIRPIDTPDAYGSIGYHALGRNKRSVWEIPTVPFSAASLGFKGIDHFAVMSPELARTCILAGSSDRACEAMIPKLKIRANLTSEERAKVEAFLVRKGLV